MFMFVNVDPKLSGNMQNHGYLGCFHAASAREKYIWGLCHCMMRSVFHQWLVEYKISNGFWTNIYKLLKYFYANTSATTLPTKTRRVFLNHRGRVSKLCNRLVRITVFVACSATTIFWTVLACCWFGPWMQISSEIWIKIHQFSYRKSIKMSSAKWRPFFQPQL